MDDQHLRSAAANRSLTPSSMPMFQQLDSQRAMDTRFPANNFHSSCIANVGVSSFRANSRSNPSTNAQFMPVPQNVQSNFHHSTQLPSPLPSQYMFHTTRMPPLLQPSTGPPRMPPPLQPNIGQPRMPPPLQPNIGPPPPSQPNIGPPSAYLPLRPNVPPPQMPFISGQTTNTGMPRPGSAPQQHHVLPPTSSSHFAAPPPFNFSVPPPLPQRLPHPSTQNERQRFPASASDIGSNFVESFTPSRMFQESSSFNRASQDKLRFQNESHAVTNHANSIGFQIRPSMEPCVVVQNVKDAEVTPEVLERNADKDWINGVEARVRQRKADNSTMEMTIPEFRSLLREVILLNDKLRKVASSQFAGVAIEHGKPDNDTGVPRYTDQLSSLHTCTQHPESQLAIQTRIKEIQQLLNASVAVIQKKQKKIACKRKRLKRQRLERYEAEQQNAEKRAKLLEELEKWEKEEQLKQEAVKMEAEMKKAADKTLLEVRRKISDAHQSLKLLTQLRKLRRLRRDQAERKGIVTRTSADASFEERLSALTALMKQQLQLYEAEQRTLQVMLETEHEETKERVRERQKKKEDDRLKKYEQQLNEWLFGITEPISSYHPMAPFRLFYDLANHSTDALINIRKEWDMHVVPSGTLSGSGVPESWVRPPEPTDDIWASALNR